MDEVFLENNNVCVNSRHHLQIMATVKVHIFSTKEFVDKVHKEADKKHLRRDGS